MPPPTTIPLPTTAAGLADIPLTIPAADQQPGPYLVQASLFDTSTSPPTRLGTTCMPYTVGAAGDGLDLASLPTGIGAGGPADPRGVALNAQLGLDGLRGAHRRLEQLPPQLLALGTDGGDLRPVGHDLRQRLRPTTSRPPPGPSRPRDLLAPGQRRQRRLGPDGPGANGWWQGDVTGAGRLLRQRARRAAASAPR